MKSLVLWLIMLSLAAYAISFSPVFDTDSTYYKINACKSISKTAAEYADCKLIK